MRTTHEFTADTVSHHEPTLDFLSIDDVRLGPHRDAVPGGGRYHVRLAISPDAHDVETYLEHDHARLVDTGTVEETYVNLDGDGQINFVQLNEGWLPSWIDVGDSVQVTLELERLDGHERHFEGPGLTVDYTQGRVESVDRRLQLPRRIEEAFALEDRLLVRLSGDDEDELTVEPHLEVPSERNVVCVAADPTVDWVVQALPDPDRDHYHYLWRFKDQWWTRGKVGDEYVLDLDDGRIRGTVERDW